MSKVLGYGSAYLDEFFAFTPLFAEFSAGHAFCSQCQQCLLARRGIISRISSFETVHGTDLLDLVIHPDHGSYLYLAEAEDQPNPLSYGDITPPAPSRSTSIWPSPTPRRFLWDAFASSSAGRRRLRPD